MSTNSSCRAARTFYGEAQHETGAPADPERIRVVTPSRAPEWVLYDYANRSDAERTRVYANAMASDAQVA